MSDLSATNCGCGNTCQNGGLFGGNSCCLILILLLCCGNNGLGANNGCGCNDGGNNGCNSLIWILLLLACCGNGCSGLDQISGAALHPGLCFQASVPYRQKSNLRHILAGLCRVV